MTADATANTTLTKPARQMGKGYRYDMFSDEQRTLTPGSKQEATTLIKTATDMTNPVDDHEITSKGPVECGNTRALEDDSLPLERGKDFDNWWNYSGQLYQTYDTEEIPYWPSYDRMDSKAYDTEVNTCYNSAYCIHSLHHKTDHADQGATQFESRLAHGQHEINVSTKTDERIQSLKALLAEQEKAISRLKSESKARLSESKEVLRLVREERPGCEKWRDIPTAQNHPTLKTDHYFYKDPEALKCTNRKRIGAEYYGLSNTKRFRYNFRKDIPQQSGSYLERETGEENTLSKGKLLFRCISPDIKNGTSTQDEFLSFLGLVRTERV